MMPWHRKLNQKLEPYQGLVTVLLLGIAVAALYLAFLSKDHALRTAAVVWALLP